ncbi:MAG: hypothetical protein SGPRY_013321, partial [Prymnesium sp.]
MDSPRPPRSKHLETMPLHPVADISIYEDMKARHGSNFRPRLRACIPSSSSHSASIGDEEEMPSSHRAGALSREQLKREQIQRQVIQKHSRELSRRNLRLVIAPHHNHTRAFSAALIEIAHRTQPAALRAEIQRDEALHPSQAEERVERAVAEQVRAAGVGRRERNRRKWENAKAKYSTEAVQRHLDHLSTLRESSAEGNGEGEDEEGEEPPPEGAASSEASEGTARSRSRSRRLKEPPPPPLWKELQRIRLQSFEAYPVTIDMQKIETQQMMKAARDKAGLNGYRLIEPFVELWRRVSTNEGARMFSLIWPTFSDRFPCAPPTAQPTCHANVFTSAELEVGPIFEVEIEPDHLLPTGTDIDDDQEPMLERILGTLCLAHFRASNSEDISVEELMAATANRKKLANNARSMLYDK